MTQMITCPTCGNGVSTEAETCPQCGHPIAGRKNDLEEWQGKNRKGCLKAILILLTSIALLFLVLMANK